MIWTDEIPELPPDPLFLDHEQQTYEVEMDYGDLFLRALMEAIPNVSAEYFYCSNANREFAEREAERCYQNFKKSPIKKAALTYGERTFCYELYHQLRISLKALQKNTQEDRKLVLQGELQKRVLKTMTEEYFGIRQLDKEYIPDFLLHVPKDCTKQEVVMEVKSSPKLRFSHIHVDLKKIDEFISKYRFKMGIFLAVNISEDVLKDKLKTYKIRLKDTIEFTSKIHVIVSESPDKKPFQVLLSDILK